MGYQKHVWVPQEIIRGVTLNHIESGIYDEEQRAIRAESDLSDNLETEHIRATNEEGRLSNRIGTTENALTTLNGNASVPGSVDNKIASVLADVGGYKITLDHTQEVNPSTKFIYLEKDTSVAGSDKYREWIYVESASGYEWQLMGDVSLDLSNYVQKTDIASTGAVGVVKVDGSSIKISNGVISTSKSNIGLGSVPNVTTNDQTPTYTGATTLTALSSGEKLSVAFGKIAKAISSLISHIGNTNNPHSVTKTQLGLDQVGNFYAVSTAANQGLTEDQKANARANIGAGSSGGSGTVTSISTGAGLTTASGSAISTSGTIKAKLKSETQSSLTATSKGSTTDREYAVGLDASGNLAVNVPWTGTVTRVTAGAGLDGDVTTSGTIKADLKSETKSSLTATSKGTTSSREYAVGLDSAGDLSVNIPWTDTRDFKIGTTTASASNNTLYFIYTT